MVDGIGADGPAGVLVTRPAAEAEGTAARLRAMGFTPVIAPLLRVRALPLRPRARPGRAPGRAEAVLVTSGNAVAGVAGLGLPVLAVGDATAERARAAGLRDVLSAGGDAGSLLALARRACRPGAALLLASGRGQGGTLARDLRRAGFRVHHRVVYVAWPARGLPDEAAGALRAGQIRAALFLSAETARVFARLLPAALRPALGRVEALAIGEAAAQALAPLPWRRVRVSLGPSLEQVLALL